jgi:DNA invertase Pin-like site-specific DNA recombinase
MRAAIYVRVSTADQHVENQLGELREYVQRRGWLVAGEYQDAGISGAKDSRPALDRLMRDARRRRIDVITVWALDRWGRSLRHLVSSLDELQQLGVGFVSLRDGLDLSTAAGRLQATVLAGLAAFERDRLRERTLAGLERARKAGKRLGRPRVHPIAIDGLTGTVRDLAVQWGVSKSTAARWIAAGRIPSTEVPSMGSSARTHATGTPMGQTSSTGRSFSPAGANVSDSRAVSVSDESIGRLSRLASRTIVQKQPNA